METPASDAIKASEPPGSNDGPSADAQTPNASKPSEDAEPEAPQTVETTQASGSAQNMTQTPGSTQPTMPLHPTEGDNIDMLAQPTQTPADHGASSQTDDVEPLPHYTPPFVELVDRLLVPHADEIHLPLTRVEDNPVSDGNGYTRCRSGYQAKVIDIFFAAVRGGRCSNVQVLVQRGIVSPDVLSASDPDDERPMVHGSRAHQDGDYVGTTALLVATHKGDAAMVRQLVQLGADINLLARPPGFAGQSIKATRRMVAWQQHMALRRTPLMVAAAQGNIALATLFYKELGADDSIVAPDGQIALRLAADGRHREIVKLLPARRAGTWRRLRTRNAKATRKMKKAGKKIGVFVEYSSVFTFWYLPKFALWSVPKHLVVLPAYRGARYVARHPEKVWLPLWEFVKSLPKNVWLTLKLSGEAIVDLICLLAQVSVGVVKAAVLWAWNGLKNVLKALGHAGLRLLAVLHTALAAIIDFFRTVTLRDVWNGLVTALQAVFVELPQTAWRSLRAFSRYLWDAMIDVFGCLGDLVYTLIMIPVAIVNYVPRQLWKIVVAFGALVGSGFRELAVLVNPKYGA